MNYSTSLSDSLRIYKAKEFYVIHSKENNDYWEIVILKPINNGDINLYCTSNHELFASDKGLKLQEATYIINGEEKKVKALNTNSEESAIFQNALYSGQMSIKTIRKMITIDNLLLILKADGSVFNPDETH